MARLLEYLAVLAVSMQAVHALCAEGWLQFPNTDKCVKVFAEPMGHWGQAQQHCVEQSGSLGVPEVALLHLENAEQNDFLKGKLGDQDHWVGVMDYREEGEYRTDMIDGAQKVTYLPWAPNSERSEFADCVVLQPGLDEAGNVYVEEICSEPRAPICQYTLPSLCAEGWLQFPNTDKCVKVFAEPMGHWGEAQQHCVEQSDSLGVPEVELLHLENAEQNDFLKGKLGDQDHWVGVMDYRVEGEYRTDMIDGAQKVTYLPWAPNSERSEFADCVVLQPGLDEAGNVYVEEICSEPRAPICQYTLPSLCAEGWLQFPNTDKCVKVFAEPMGHWGQAQQHCVEQSDSLGVPEVELLHLENAEQNDFLKGKLGDQDHWVGVMDYREEGEYRTDMIDGAQKVTYLPWAPNSERSEFADCVVLQPGLDEAGNVYVEEICSEPRAPICQYTLLETSKVQEEEEKKGICPDSEGWVYFSPTQTCFKVVHKQKRRWHVARSECMEMGADLIIIPSQQTLDFVNDLMTIPNRYWIGLVDPDMDGVFSWLGQDEEAEFQAWRVQPKGGDNHCVEMVSRFGKWRARHCLAKKYFICQKDATLA